MAMVFSPKHEFIFVHIPKCAGISVSQALLPHSAPKVRPMGLRLLSRLPLPIGPHLFAPPVHATAAWARTRLGKAVWDRWTSLCVIRDPADRMVSLYDFIRTKRAQTRGGKIAARGFEAFIAAIESGELRVKSQLAYVSAPGDGLIVDRVLRFETLEEDFARTWDELQLPGKAMLAHRNKSLANRNDTKVDSGTRSAIERVFREDYETFFQHS